MADPLWGRSLQTGALTGTTAQKMIEKFGEERAKLAAIKYRTIMDEHAMRNPKAHRRLSLDRNHLKDYADGDLRLVGELRMLHMCSQSDGACAVVFASEDKVNQLHAKPRGGRPRNRAPRRDHDLHLAGKYPPYCRRADLCAERYHQAGRADRCSRDVRSFGLVGVDWLRDFLLLEGDEASRWSRRTRSASTARSPSTCPAVSSRASDRRDGTGSRGEAALQIRGTAGERQVPKPVRMALATGFGGTLWTVLMLLSREKPRLGAKAHE